MQDPEPCVTGQQRVLPRGPSEAKSASSPVEGGCGESRSPYIPHRIALGCIFARFTAEMHPRRQILKKPLQVLESGITGTERHV